MGTFFRIRGYTFQVSIRWIPGFFVLVLGSLSVAAATQSPPPAIEPLTLQPYTRGTGAIAGTATFFRNGGALCAPDIPYVAWFVNESQLGNHPRYDDRLQPYTHNAQVALDGTFTCAGLSPGRYIVWFETLSPADPIRSPMSLPGVLPPQTFSLPQHVVVNSGTVTITFNQL
jgi:hypothetical protein